MFAFIAFLPLLAAQADSGTETAQAALRRLGERMRSVRTFSAGVKQSRKTALLKDPLVSSGTLYYRRKPPRLVVLIDSPRAARIHLDAATYQVYRPEQGRLERLHLSGKGPIASILDLFQPVTADLEKAFELERLPSKEDRLRLRLRPREAATRRRVDHLEMELSAKDGSLRTIIYADPDGDLVTLSISDPRFDPDLPEKTFDLSVPEGTRIIDQQPPGKDR